MPKRPYLPKTAAELEAIFKTDGGEYAILKALAHELGFRSTQASQRLAKRVQNALDSHAAKASAPSKSPSFSTAKPAVQKALTPMPTPVSNRQRTGDDWQPEITPRPPLTAAPDAADLFAADDQATSSVPEPASRSRPRPAVSNQPEEILRAWTALEVLSPTSIRRWSSLNVQGLRHIVSLKEDRLPWDGGAKAVPNKKVLFEIFLGTIGVAKATESLLKVYSDSRPERPNSTGKAILASIIVDKNGCPFEEEDTLAISSFGWGVPVALKGDLTELGRWPTAERRLKQELQKHLIRRNKDGEIASLTKAAIDGAYRFLVRELSLSGQELEGPDYALRRYEFFANKQPPEPSLLNSFFLNDLERARELFSANQEPHSLKLYLGRKAPSSRLNLLEDNAALREILRPANTPLGRWPAPGRHPLVLLQQAAVNGSVRELKDAGILSVNGPPGTGKTTLLRDIVVARIVERAEAMARYDDPAQAFHKSGETMQRQGATLTLHRLDSALRGFEMVVVSSNNKAVENVSAELPGLGAIAEDATDLRYFKSVSDKVLQGESWGMIAAVLGNSNNRYKFAEAYWRDAEHGMATYLNHASGTPQVETHREDDGRITYRTRKIVLEENPPKDRSEARRRWHVAQTAFLAALTKSRQQQADFDSIHDALFVPSSAESEIVEHHTKWGAVKTEIQSTHSEMSIAERTLKQCQLEAEQLQGELRHIELNAPAFLARLFRAQSVVAWRQRRAQLQANFNDIRQAGVASENRITKLQSRSLELDKQLAEISVRLEQLETEISHRKKALENARTHPAIIPDADFFSMDHRERQLATLWFDAKAQNLRDELFSAAIALHRAFIDAAADPIRQNLAIFMETFGTKSLGTPAKDRLIEDLWATFFLAVPVVSTTFASVERMFSRLRPEALGWLLIDEAGQASPQSAVGALMRSKRAVVVGDPLQIEPVVSLPTTLTEEICAQFGVSSEKSNAPQSSVQTIADRASPYSARFPAGSGHREVGSPLLVHRRCDSPMFDISNTIAYANLMVQAKAAVTTDPPLGPSRWIDVRGQSDDDKWSEAEGRKVMDLLSQLKSSDQPADLYVVTPFVVVQDNIRRLLSDDGVLVGWVEKPGDWVLDHVGTVHTVQGREASSVIFVLGAPSSGQTGARSWAGANPNLLNVAVTRAKRGLYVVGNRDLWSQAGVFRELDRLLA